MQAVSVALAILAALSSLLGALYQFRSVYVVMGLFVTRVFPKAKKLHRYAVVIAARNEAGVIGKLLDSIRRQDYPAELLTVFVVADNCTDATAEVARAHGAICYERFDDRHRTKGYALQFLFEQIRRDYGIASFEAYLLFDADNLLKSDYVSRMNEAFDAGECAVTSYRNTKNFAANWISASYGLHWLRTIRTEHRARSWMGLATRIQGTGILLAARLLENGWNYTSLAEDRELCAEIVAGGNPISYCNAAEYYDEQPVSFRIAMRQRLRWSKGHLQVMRSTCGRLFRRMFTARTAADSFMAYDMLSIVFPVSLCSSLTAIARLLIWLFVWVLTAEPFGVFGAALLAWAVSFVRRYLGSIVTAVYVFLTERRHVPPLPWYKYLWFSLTFPLFDCIGRLTTLIALFTKVEWKPIPHTFEVSIEEMHGEKQAAAQTGARE